MPWSDLHPTCKESRRKLTCRARHVKNRAQTSHGLPPLGAVQGPVELEAAEAAGGAPVSESTTADNDAALRWNLLLQIDTDDDAEMMWGDCGMLYWMTDAGEAEPIIAEHTSFTWQCG